MGRWDVAYPYDHKRLEVMTDNFSKENYLGKFQFGELYRGRIFNGSHRLVKIFDSQNYEKRINAARLRDELLLLQHSVISLREALVRLDGYCKFNDQFYIIYELNSLDTLHHLVPEDNFTWLNRVKVALKIASLLKFLHGDNPYRLRFQLRNLNASHIMLDKDYNPKLFDFSWISNGIFPTRSITNSLLAHCLSNKNEKLLTCHDYYAITFGDQGWLMEKCDVFAFGILLLMLISKKACSEEECLRCDLSSLRKWVNEQFKADASNRVDVDRSCYSLMHSYSLAHKSLEEEPVFCSKDGPRISKLAMDCVANNPSERPTMKNVVDCLLNLQVVKQNAYKYDLCPKC